MSDLRIATQCTNRRASEFPPTVQFGVKTIIMKYFLIVLLLCFTAGIPAEEKVCEVDRSSIVERVVNRTYPSVFSGWEHEITNEPKPENVWEWSYQKRSISRRDLFWQGGFIANVFFQRRTNEGTQIVFRRGRYADDVLDKRRQIQSLNPDFLFLAEINYYGIHVEDGYREEWPYWLRDEAGNIVHDPDWNQHLIDFTLPGAEDHFVEMAVSVAKCGIFDGIFMDLWSESEADLPGTPIGEKAHLYHGNQVEVLVSLVKRIREAVGDEFLIMVNARTEKIPRSAPYVNGAFIETWDKAYPRERLIELENALSWYEENLRFPQINCLEVAKNHSETWDSPANRRLARAATTLTLTHSNGYILVHNKAQNFGARYWYPFWDAPLGGTLGGDETKGVLYEIPNGEEIEGLFIREFTNGWAVYNRSGKAQEIELPQEVSGWASGVENQRQHTLADLDGEIYLKAETRPIADVNRDGIVNILDLVTVANAFGKSAPDLNGDGVVNILDLVAVANAF